MASVAVPPIEEEMMSDLDDMRRILQKAGMLEMEEELTLRYTDKDRQVKEAGPFPTLRVDGNHYNNLLFWFTPKGELFHSESHVVESYLTPEQEGKLR